MARVRASIVVDGNQCWALFDTGAVNSYIIAERVGSLPSWKLSRPEPAALGGKAHSIDHECALVFLVNGYEVRTRARIVKEIGRDEDEKRIEVLVGALAMEEWRFHPVPHEERLDFTHYPKEFVEFSIFNGQFSINFQ